MQVKVNDYIDFDKIIESGQTFRAKKLNDNLYRFVSLENVLYISNATPKNLKSRKTSKVKCTFNASCTEDEWKKFWYNYFDLNRSYKDIKINECFSKKCEEVSRGIRILRQDPFEMLISFIISQRKSIPAIRTSIEEICRRFGTRIDTEYEEELYLFPTVDQLTKGSDCSDNLAECKLGYRLPYIEDALNTVKNNKSFLSDGFNMTDEELLNHLITIKGVGVKVANCVALFAYNRTGLAPVDTWIKKIIDDKYNGVSPFENYGENAGIIQQYMFYYALTHKDEF